MIIPRWRWKYFRERTDLASNNTGIAFSGGWGWGGFWSLHGPWAFCFCGVFKAPLDTARFKFKWSFFGGVACFYYTGVY